jgi:arylsulfatase A-like enzyme
MATEGVRFTSFYTESLCSPTRASLLTGCYAHRIGVDQVFWPDSDTGLNPDEITIAELLHEAGYSTALIGKWHLGHSTEFLPTNQGFDYFFGLPYSNDMGPDARREGFGPLPLMRNTEIIEQGPDLSTLTRRYTEEAINFISENKGNPFFIILAHTFPHVPLFAGKEFKGSSAFGLYGDVVEEIDWSTGALLDKLTELGLDENTIVVFTSDNGPWLHQGDHGGLATPLRDGKGTSWEGGQRVPAIFKWPGVIPAGTVNDKISSIMDLYPTLAKWSGAQLPADRIIDGRNIGPLLEGINLESPHDTLLYYRLRNLQAIRIGDWKLHLEGSRLDYNNPDYDYTNAFRFDMKEALYNLAEDPGEQRNLIRSKPEIASQLREAAMSMGKDMQSNRRPIGQAETNPEIKKQPQ